MKQTLENNTSGTDTLSESERLLEETRLERQKIEEIEKEEQELLKLKDELKAGKTINKTAVADVEAKIEKNEEKKAVEIKKIEKKQNELKKKILEGINSFAKLTKKIFGGKERAEIEKKSMGRGPAAERIVQHLEAIAKLETEKETYVGNTKDKANPATIKEINNKIIAVTEKVRGLSTEYEIYGPEIKKALDAINADSTKLDEVNAIKANLTPEGKNALSSISKLEKKLVEARNNNASIEEIEKMIEKITKLKARVETEKNGSATENKEKGAKEKVQLPSKELIKYNADIEAAKSNELIKYNADIENAKNKALEKYNEKSDTFVNPDGSLSKVINVDIKNPGNPTPVIENKILNTAESKKELARYMEVCKSNGMGNIIEQAAGIVPGFNELPDSQKMLVMQGMNDELLNYINETSAAKFEEKMAGKTTKFGKFMAGMGKNYSIAKFRKEELAMIQGNKNESAVRRMDFIKAKVPGLVKVFGESGIGAYLDKDGGKVMADFANRKNLEGATPAVKKSAENFNKLANKLAHTPQEDKQAYAKVEKAFEKAQAQYLDSLEKYESEKGNKSSKYMTAEFVKQATTLMRSMSFIAADQNTAERLSNISTDPVFMQRLNSIASERGLMMAGGAGARKVIVYSLLGGVAITAAPFSGMVALAVAGSIGISGGMSYLTGKKRAEKGLEEKDKLARRGEKQKGNTAIGMGNVTRHLDRIKTLRTQLEDKNISEIKRKEITEQLRTVADFVSAKMERREINFGKDKPGTPVEQRVFVVQNRLMNELHEAYVDMDVDTNADTYMNIFDNKASGAELGGSDSRTRRLIHVHGARNVGGTEAARNKQIKEQAKKSAKYGMLFASAGMVVAEAAHYFDWHIPGFGHNGTEDVNNATKPEGWHSPMVLPGNQNGNGPEFYDPTRDWMKVGTNPANHAHHVGGGHHGAHHAPHHNAPHTPEVIEKLPTSPIKPIDVSAPAQTPMPLIPENQIPHVEYTAPHEWTNQEIMEHEFSPADDDIIRKIAEHNRGLDMEHFFKHHHNWLDKSAKHIENRNEGGVWNPTKRELDAYMDDFTEKTGYIPRKGQSVDDYLKFIEEYNARKTFLEGDYSKDFIDYKYVNPVPLDQTVPAPDGSVAHDAVNNAVNTNTGPTVPADVNHQPIANAPVTPAKEIVSNSNSASPAPTIDNTPTFSNGGSETISPEIMSEGHLINTHLNSLDHSSYNHADFNRHTELLDRPDLQEAGIKHMNLFIQDHGIENWNRIRDINPREYLNSARPDGNMGAFYDLLKTLKDTDPVTFNRSTSLDGFMIQVYIKDEVIKYYLENLSQDAIGTPNQ